MFGAGLSVLSGAAGLGISAAGGVGSLLSNAFGVGEKAGGAVIGGVVGGIHKAMQGGSFVASVSAAIGGALTGAIIVGITSSVKSAVAQAQGILAQSQATGAGIGASTRSSYNLAAFGIRPDSVSGISSNNAYSQGMMGAAYGVRGAPGSAEYLRSYSNRYQSLSSQGALGLMQAQGMEGALGMQGARGMANLSPEMRERQFGRSNAMQSGLAMNPADVRRGAQEMTLLGSSFSQFFSLLRDKGGSAIVRNLTIPLNNALDWIISHSDGIGKSIERGVDGAFEALHKVGSWLYADFPVMLLSGLETLASTAGDLVSQLPETFSELGQNIKYSLLEAMGEVPQLLGDLFAPVGDYLKTTILPPLMTFFDGAKAAVSGLLNDPQIAAFLRTAARVVPLTGAINNGAGNAARALGAPEAVEDGLRGGGGSWLTLAGLGLAGRSLLGRGLGAAGRGLSTVGRAAFGGISATAAGVMAAGTGLGIAGYEGLRKLNIGGFGDNTYSTAEIAKNWWNGGAQPAQAAKSSTRSAGGGAMQASIGGASDWWKGVSERPAWSGEIRNGEAPKDFNHSLKGLRDGFTERANRLEKFAGDKKDEIGSVEERRAAYKAWHEIANNTKRSADAADKLPTILDRFGNGIAARALSYERQDTKWNIVRGGGRA